MNGLLELTHQCLGWPTRQDIMKPKGAGPAVIADLARRKIGTAISRQNVEVEVGVLTANPCSNKTEDPLAIVCDFSNYISEDVLRETHRLVWSFSRSPMLITVEPSIIKVWTCWERPLEKDDRDAQKLLVESLGRDSIETWSFSEQAAKALQWIQLTSGGFFSRPEYSRYFRREQRADQLMLEDLKAVRKKLLYAELPEDICHDLLARVIFIEFLFQRKDSQGNAALNENVLSKLHENRILSKVHRDLSSILETHGETYRFFRELNSRFNGDLFPGKGKTEEEREEEWKAEMVQVKDEHLELLREFIRGQMDISFGQRCLWPKYAFDAIPLEFISSIYEEFAKKKGSGVHYTPGYIVDLVLDEVLPWSSAEWDIKILDPACGSGIFLVKAYQRLINRWKIANEKPKAKVSDLRGLLLNNLFGVDTNRDAVRVASFSLYLAMCDEIEPKHVWQKNLQFPRLRDKTLINSDFFVEDKEGFRTSANRDMYDLVIGNAPWGHRMVSEKAKTWAKHWNWSLSNQNFGPLFLCKSAYLTKATGRIAMLQPAGAMLFNRHSTAVRFRAKFFSMFTVDKIFNLAALRFGLFKNAISPACLVFMRPVSPAEDPIIYIFPKPRHTKEDDNYVVVETSDINLVYPEEAADDSMVWTTLAWGGRRDLALMRQLCQELNLQKLEWEGVIKTRRGIGRGKREERQDEIVGMPILNSETFPEGTLMYLDAKRLDFNEDPFLYKGHSKDLSAFKLPQMILKLGWRKGKTGRFRAVLVNSDENLGPVVCSSIYISIHAPFGYESLLASACISLNSIIAVYFSLLSSGRFAFYRPSPNKEDLLRIPIPKCDRDVLKRINKIEDVDVCVRQAFRLKDAEWVLIEDLFNYTLQDFKGGMYSPGRKSTHAEYIQQEGRYSEAVLKAYCEYMVRVLHAGFGKDKKISATIFTEGRKQFLPVRLIAIHLETPCKQFVQVEYIDSIELIERLKDLDLKLLESRNQPENGGIFYQRVARVYDNMLMNGQEVPTIFIIKPDQVRYWTRAMAMRDADEVAGDIMLWQEESRSKRNR
jgi:hypothetical protein